MTNTDLQHYSGDQHLSNFSQIFFGIFNLFLSAAIGLAALVAIIRALRSDSSVGNFFVDMWRVLVYMFVPAALIFGLIFITQGSPMTFQTSHDVSTLEAGAMGTTDTGEAKPQTIIVGPVAALESMKMLGTNGGGFYGMNSAHPFENPTGLSNFFNTFAMMMFPFALVFMFGRMLNRFRHSLVIFAVMMVMMAGTIGWSIYFDTLKPNPGLNRTIRGTEVRNSQRGISGWKAHGESAGSSEPARRAASGQSRRQGDAFRDFGGRNF